MVAAARHPGFMRAAAAVVLAALAWAPEARSQVLLDRVLAVVSGTVITMSDARAVLELGLVDPGAGDPVATALSSLIDWQLVLDEAQRYEVIEHDAAGVEAALAAARRRLASDEAWTLALARLGLTEAGVRSRVGDVLFARAYADRRFSAQYAPSDEELRAAYERQRERFTRDGQVLPFYDVRDELEASLTRQRRDVGIAEWIARLRRRADVSELYVPVR